ncbi:MAG: hypothetical protein CL910_02940 [Deltaproteobacteria bacterium]|nr:hypothetical protein [Deltaproteobacteria bacterium]
MNRAVIGEPAERRLRCNRLGMRFHLPLALRHGTVSGAWHGPELVGVRVSLPAGSWPLPLAPWPARLRLALQQGFGPAGRWAEVARVLESCHPLGGHAYLSTLGVLPAAQRGGVGRALLWDWLDEVDRDGAWAWLETDRAECLPLYRSGGFEVRDEIEVLGVPVSLMERPTPTAEAVAVG